MVVKSKLKFMTQIEATNTNFSNLKSHNQHMTIKTQFLQTEIYVLIDFIACYMFCFTNIIIIIKFGKLLF